MSSKHYISPPLLKKHPQKTNKPKKKQQKHKKQKNKNKKINSSSSSSSSSSSPPPPPPPLPPSSSSSPSSSSLFSTPFWSSLLFDVVVFLHLFCFIHFPRLFRQLCFTLKHRGTVVNVGFLSICPIFNPTSWQSQSISWKEIVLILEYSSVFSRLLIQVILPPCHRLEMTVQFDWG